MHLVLLSWYHPEVFMWKQQVKWLISVQFHYQLRIWGLRIILKWIQLFYHSICLHSLISNPSLLRWLFWFTNWVHSQWTEWIDFNSYWMNSFTRSRWSYAERWNREFHVKNCGCLRELIIGRYSFSDYVYSIYPIFLNSEPSPLELLIDPITSIMLMMLIWLVRMSVRNDWKSLNVRNDWKSCVELNGYVLADMYWFGGCDWVWFESNDWMNE